MSATGPFDHAAIGTPTSSASSLEAILSPSRSMTSGEGPTNTMSMSRHSRANSAFSDTKPQPGHTASARATDRPRRSSA
jgi:hypothetical protein